MDVVNLLKYLSLTVLSLLAVIVGDTVTAQHYWLQKEQYKTSRG